MKFPHPAGLLTGFTMNTSPLNSIANLEPGSLTRTLRQPGPQAMMSVCCGGYKHFPTLQHSQKLSHAQGTGLFTLKCLVPGVILIFKLEMQLPVVADLLPRTKQPCAASFQLCPHYFDQLGKQRFAELLGSLQELSKIIKSSNKLRRVGVEEDLPEATDCFQGSSRYLLKADYLPCLLKKTTSNCALQHYTLFFSSHKEI